MKKPGAAVGYTGEFPALTSVGGKPYPPKSKKKQK